MDRDLHIPRASLLVSEILRRWPGLRFVVCDRFRLQRSSRCLRRSGYGDSASNKVELRQRQDIRAVRQLALDGNLSVEPRSRALMRIALAAAVVQHDSSGNSRLIKKWIKLVLSAMTLHMLSTLACGALSRLREATPACTPHSEAVGVKRTHDRRWLASWQRLRRRALDRDSWRCQQCGRVGGAGSGRLEVHHCRSVRDGGTDDLSNLLVLCRGCHVAIHRPREPTGKAEWRSWISQ